MEVLLTHHALGKVVPYIIVTEFQKRGLPHVHAALTFAPEDELRTPEDIDRVVCAELPGAHPAAQACCVLCPLTLCTNHARLRPLPARRPRRVPPAVRNHHTAHAAWPL